MGKTQACTSFFKRCVVVHASCFPMVVSLVATQESNIGMLSQAVLKLQATLEPLRKEAESEAWMG